jgi:hypothetical protein
LFHLREFLQLDLHTTEYSIPLQTIERVLLPNKMFALQNQLVLAVVVEVEPR